MLVLIGYTDYLGRKCRLTVDDGAWLRQEWRGGGWETMERHPVEDLDTPLGGESMQQQPATAEGQR